MKKLRKYEFGSKAAASAKINALGTETTPEGDVVPNHNHSIVRLGHIVVTEGTYDDDGEELTPPVLSDNYCVDMLWNGEPDPSWEAQLVWPNPNVLGVHVFGSSSAIREYISTVKSIHPEYFPEPSEEDLI